MIDENAGSQQKCGEKDDTRRRSCDGPMATNGFGFVRGHFASMVLFSSLLIVPQAHTFFNHRSFALLALGFSSVYASSALSALRSISLLNRRYTNGIRGGRTYPAIFRNVVSL